MKQNNKKRFLSVLLGTWSASLYGNLLTVDSLIRASEDTNRAGQDF